MEINMGLRGAVPGVCDICNREVGHVPKHRKACARKAGQPALTGPPTKGELNLIERAGAHAAAEAVLDHDRRLQNGVSDLDVARLLAFLDAGGEVNQRERIGHWYAPEGSPLRNNGPHTRRTLSQVVNEAIRLGLAFEASERLGPLKARSFVAPALVHKRSHLNRLAPTCSRPMKSIKRYRLVDRLDLVDCQACVDIASI